MQEKGDQACWILRMAEIHVQIHVSLQRRLRNLFNSLIAPFSQTSQPIDINGHDDLLTAAAKSAQPGGLVRT